MSKWHDEKQISACCQDYQNGKSVQELLHCYSISKTTLYRWLQRQRRTDEHGAAKNLDRKTISEFERQRKMLEIYQKTGLGTGSPFSERVVAIQSLNGEYSLNLLCLTLGVPKATYYRAIESKETQFEIKCKTLTPIIEEIFNESKQSYGARKITEILREKGFSVSPNTVAKIMHGNGWFSVRAGAKSYTFKIKNGWRICFVSSFRFPNPTKYG